MINIPIQSILISAAETEADLIKVITSDAGRYEKSEACRKLSAVGTKAAVPALAAMLADPNLSHNARYALETIPDPSVDEALKAQLKTLKGLPLVGVIGSIGMRKDATAVPALIEFLDSDDKDVVEGAAKALGNMGDVDAAKALVEKGTELADNAAKKNILMTVCESLLRAAENLLKNDKKEAATRIYGVLFKHRSKLPSQVGAAALRGAALNSEDGLKMVMEAFKGDDIVLATAAISFTQETCCDKVTKAMAAELKSLPANKQLLVVNLLAKRGDVSVLADLIPLAKAGDKNVRLAAIAAFPTLGDASALPVLEEIQKDADADVASAAKRARRTLGRKAASGEEEE